MECQLAKTRTFENFIILLDKLGTFTIIAEIFECPLFENERGHLKSRI
jgi:hypothetical protein